MNYTLLVLAAPATGVPKRALAFAHAALARGHAIQRVFFHDEGVLCGLRSAVEAQDETDQLAGWREFARDSGAELVVCVSSALRRGVLDSTEAERHEHASATLDEAFIIGGLGLLIEAGNDSERLITFGGEG